MATYYGRNTGGNWNLNSTWSTVSSSSSTNTGTFPGAADTAILDSGSGNITINVSSTVLILSANTYTGTLTFNNNLLMANNATITLGSGMTVASDVTSRALRMQLCTVTSNGVYLPITITAPASAPSITLNDDLDVANVSTYGSYNSNSSTLRKLKIRGNFTVTSPLATNDATPVQIYMTGAISGATYNSGGYNLTMPFELDASGNTVTFAANSPFATGTNSFTFNFKVTTGTLVTTGIYVTFSSNAVVVFNVDASSVLFEKVIIVGLVQLNSTLSATTIATAINNTGIVATLQGTSGFVCDILSLNESIGLGAYRSLNLGTGATYNVNLVAKTPDIPIAASVIQSSSSTVLATLNLNGGSSLIRCNMTRIDASGGCHINTIGTITNCKNVGTSMMNILI